jgi:hypothetical protein
VVQRVQSEVIAPKTSTRRAPVRKRTVAPRAPMPPDDETAGRETDAIIARLDDALAKELEPDETEPHNLMDRVTGSFRRLSSVFGIGSQSRETTPPADDDAAEKDIDATIARLDAGIPDAMKDMSEILGRLRKAA